MYGASPRCVTETMVAILKRSSLSDHPITTSDDDLSSWLWDQTAETRVKAFNTHFIQGIKNGTLHPTGFGGYMVQDAMYCYYVQKSLDQAIAREEMGPLKDFLQQQSNDYKSYYEDLFSKWHIRDGCGIDLGKGCQDYVDCIANVAQKDNPVYMLVAGIPCARLWPWLGQQLNAQPHSYGAYTDWVNKSLDPTSVEYKDLEVRVNAAYSDDKLDKTLALNIYSQCMNGEANFFSSVPNP